MTVVLRINPSHQVLGRNSPGSTVSPGTRGEAAEGRCMDSGPWGLAHSAIAPARGRGKRMCFSLTLENLVCVGSKHA